MPKSPGIAPPAAFTGATGRHKVIEALRSQTLIAWDTALARQFAKMGTILHYGPGAVLVAQGDSDNDLFLILGGEVEVLVNGRPVATRAAGTHVGEIALADSLAKRSATLKALEATTVFRVPEHKFTGLAQKHADLWRRVAVEISRRLRERNKALRQPHTEPVLFIGSSSEGLSIATEVHRSLSPRPLVLRLWTEDVFQASSTAIESLVAQTKEADFAALVLTADDVKKTRRATVATPRDNVIFELGLFMGALGRDRTFILKPKNVNIRIPSDLLGVTWVEYARKGPQPLRTRLRSACRRLWTDIQRIGPR